MSRLRSPLRFPGGKSRAVKTITARFPAGIDTLVSSFMGGGSVELWAAQQGIEVLAYDGFLPVARFWAELLFEPHRLVGHVQSYYPMSKEKFKELQRAYKDCPEVMPGAVFFALNRASFSGTTTRGGCSDPSARFTQSSIDYLRKFANFEGDLTVSHSLWQDTLAKHPDGFMYLDPPYVGKDALYAEIDGAFDHEGLAKALRARSAPWLLSYADCPEVRELYQEFTIEEVSWSNSMRAGGGHKNKELLIRNYD